MIDSAPVGPGRRALISLGALERNLRRLVVDRPDAVLDVRADAFGHGLGEVARIAAEAGVRGFRISDERDALRLSRAGVGGHRLTRDAATPQLPVAAAFGLEEGWEPVMTLVGEVITTKAVPAGSGVSYGYTYRTARASRLALVGLGYADGVPRLGSNRARVLLAGSTRLVAGRIAMDQLVLDCGDDAVDAGAPAVVFGDPATGAPAPWEWARLTGRRPTELTSGVAARVPRIAVPDDAGSTDGAVA